MIKQVKFNAIPEFWGVFVVIDILNVAEGVIKHHRILRVNMPCGTVQYQRDIAGMGRTIPKEDAAPGR